MEEVGDKKGIANSLNYLGILYKNEGDPKCQLSKDVCRKNGLTKALEFFTRAIKIQDEIGDKYGKAASLNSIGLTYKIQGDPSCDGTAEECVKAGTFKAIEYCNRSLKLLEEIGHKDGIAIALNNLAELYMKQKQYDKALDYCTRSFKMSQEMGYPENIAMAANDLSKIYRIKGDYKKSLEYKELFVKMKDSINSESNRKASIKTQLKYEYEKQAAADSVAHAKETEIKNAEISRQNSELKVKRNQQYALYGGLALVLVFSGFIFNRFKVTKRQNVIIEKQKKEVEQQKHLVEEKQKEIVDSIQYARRIQRALITSEKYVDRNLERLRK
jgi:tetratricopeptide (TPR) repeat protein